jgi:hypothetical protein
VGGLDANSILLSLFLGLVGFAVLVYGKRQSRVPHMTAGLVLMVYPYFVTNLYLMGGIAVAIVAALWGAVRFGW